MSSPTSPLKWKAIRAGAGAGKTYSLTHEVIEGALQFRELFQRWPRFVVTTFTRKATQELSERLMTLCLEKFPQALDFVSSSQHLKISTIHGVLDDFLKDQGSVLGLKSEFVYMGEAEALFISKKVLKDVFEKTPPLLLQKYFSFSQIHQFLRQASESDLSDYRPFGQKEGEALIDEKLADCRKRLQQLLDNVSTASLPEKWHLLANQLQHIANGLSLHAWKNNQQTLELIDSLDLKGGLKLKSHPDSQVLYESLKAAVESLRELTHPSCQFSSLDILNECNQAFSELLKIYQKNLWQEKITFSCIEMSDLELLTLQVLSLKKDAASLWGGKKDYWFIDEFQDTSPQQLKILKKLIDAKPYYLVGDPQQSIYLFRGARTEVFAEQFSMVESRGGETRSLMTNYRSQPTLLNFINEASESLGQGFAVMSSAHDTPESQKSTKDVTLFVAAEDQREQEFVFVEETVRRLHREGVGFEEIAILVRRNRDLEDVGQYLSRKNIPVHLHSSGLFWKRREVLSALALLQFLLYPHDNENLTELLRCPLLTVSDSQLAFLANQKGDSLWSKMDKGCESGEWGHAGVLLWRALKARADLGVVEIFENSLRELGFFDFHLHLDPTGRSEGNLWKFVGLLKKHERERGASFVEFIHNCRRAIEHESSVDSPGSIEKNKVNIMTVHAAKGLQFNYVLLPFLGQKPYRETHLSFSLDEQEKVWSLRAPAKEFETQSTSSLFEKKVLRQFHARQDEEDHRVLYVALTRAIREMYLSWTEAPHESSWAQSLQFLLDENRQFSFELHRWQMPEGNESVSSTSKVIEKSEPLRSPYRLILPEDLQIKKQSVTQLVSQVNKNYRAAYIKKQQGILFHKLVEVIKYPVAKDIPHLLDTWFGDEQENVLQALNYILQLETPPLVEIMKAGHVEWAFRYLQNGQPVDGQIDLWALYGEELWIVDYKSGEKILLEKSFAQLGLYAEALRAYLQWTGPIKTAVLYPFLQTSFVRSL